MQNTSPPTFFNTTRKIRTRFAPSPTGFVHLGNIRSALYPWAFARHTKGDFILRIEDTDLERSSQEAVDVIINSMNWLGLDIDQGPIFQTQRLERYQAALDLLLAKGLAYPCYMTSDELDELREQQLANKEKTKYNNFWRPEIGKTLPKPPTDVKPVYRFKNPLIGTVRWIDAVKGEIIIENQELDDFIIARSEGMPTYNFCVVVDDIDMQITHVIRGDDHVNNTPKQINLIKALITAQEQNFSEDLLPTYAHLPTVLNEQGEKMSKRHGAIGVLDYQKQGFLPEALINYLARLGWSHGDDEIITKSQLIEWFDLNHLGTSAAQHNPEKLAWLNTHYIKVADVSHLKTYFTPLMNEKQLDYLQQKNIDAVLKTYQERSHTLLELINYLDQIYNTPIYTEDTLNELAKISDAQKALLLDLMHTLNKLELNNDVWQREYIQALIKEKLTQHALKMPQLGVPLRLILVNHTQTPSLDVLIYLIGQKAVVQRLGDFLS